MAVSWRGAVIALAVAACSSRKPKPVEENHKRDDGAVLRDAAAAAVAPVGPIAPMGPYRVEQGPSSDVQIRVEWKDVPLAARASPGRTPCGTPKPGAVASTVTWGIPEVFVVLAIDHGKPMPELPARVVLDHCLLAPRVVVAGTSVTIASAAEQPVSLPLVEEGKLAEPAKLAAGTARAVMLPVAGHEVAAQLEAATIYRLGEDPEAWIIATPHPYAGITDASGVVMLRDVPVGSYGVLAWLPPRAGQPARMARGEVKVQAGALAEVTLDLTSSP